MKETPFARLKSFVDDGFPKEIALFNGIPKEVLKSPELIELLLQTLRADYEAKETDVYSPELPLFPSVSSFGGLQDHRVPQDALES